MLSSAIMFDNLLKEIKRLERGVNFSLPVEADEEGNLDKQCPFDECSSVFKISNECWNQIPDEASIFCPYCRHEAHNEEWFTKVQQEEAEKQARKYVESRLGIAMRKDAERFNRRQPFSSFLSIKAKHNSNVNFYGFIPLKSVKELEQKKCCSHCSFSYVVLGAGFFCPQCGNNSAHSTLDDGMKKICLKVETAESLEILGRSDDDIAIMKTSLFETALVDCVVSFQRFCEATYASINDMKPLRLNVFQRLDDGSKVWQEVLGEGYENWLSTDEFFKTHLQFQRRHLLQHREGIVDEKYLKNSGDKIYKLGMKIVVKGADVLELVKNIKSLVNAINSKVKML